MDEYVRLDNIIKVLEKSLNKSFNEIKEDVSNTKIKYTRDELTKDSNKIKKKIESYSFTDKFMYKLEHGINLDEFDYQEKNIALLKTKLEAFLYIIEKIGTNDLDSIKDEIQKYDITIKNNKILKKDVTRLVTPTVYIYKELESSIKNANSINTYTHFKASHDSLDHIQGKLQYISLENDLYDDNIKLTDKQKDDANKKYQKTLEFLKRSI